jgi:predicted  nucleic acid-binding Zn-ribbon protein
MLSNEEFDAKLSQIMGDIHTLPPTEQAKIHKLAGEARERQERLRKTVSTLQESLDYLRLSVKYLVFDLEATRRENQYLRKLLEEAGGQGGGGKDNSDA